MLAAAVPIALAAASPAGTRALAEKGFKRTSYGNPSCPEGAKEGWVKTEEKRPIGERKPSAPNRLPGSAAGSA